jgi:hypothetical protein
MAREFRCSDILVNVGSKRLPIKVVRFDPAYYAHARHETIMSESKQPEAPTAPRAEPESAAATNQQPGEIGGRGGADPTRYGDWEKNGRCIDF